MALIRDARQSAAVISSSGPARRMNPERRLVRYGPRRPDPAGDQAGWDQHHWAVAGRQRRSSCATTEAGPTAEPLMQEPHARGPQRAAGAFGQALRGGLLGRCAQATTKAPLASCVPCRVDQTEGDIDKDRARVVRVPSAEQLWRCPSARFQRRQHPRGRAGIPSASHLVPVLTGPPFPHPAWRSGWPRLSANRRSVRSVSALDSSAASMASGLGTRRAAPPRQGRFGRRRDHPPTPSTRPDARETSRKSMAVVTPHDRDAALRRCLTPPSPAADTGPWLPPACGARKHSVRRCCRLLRPWTWFSKNPSALGRRR